MLVIASCGFLAASVLGGLAAELTLLVAARALQGISGALLAPATLSLLATTFAGSPARGRAFGVFGAVSISGSVVGLLLGGALTETLGWRWCLLVNVPIALLIVVVARSVVPAGSRRSDEVRLDVPGALTSVLGVLALLYGFSAAERTSWNSVPTVGLVLVGVGLLVLFVHLQRRSAHPILPMAVVLDRDRGGAYLTVALGGIGIFGVFLFLAYHLQQIRRFTPIETGLAFVPMVVSMALLSILAGGVLLPRAGARAVVTSGFVLAAAGTWWFTRLTVDTDRPDRLFGLGALLCGPLLTGRSGRSGSRISAWDHRLRGAGGVHGGQHPRCGGDATHDAGA